jgi:hypothetical protein
MVGRENIDRSVVVGADMNPWTPAAYAVSVALGQYGPPGP